MRDREGLAALVGCTCSSLSQLNTPAWLPAENALGKLKLLDSPPKLVIHIPLVLQRKDIDR